jgi:hypothetical protein
LMIKPPSWILRRVSAFVLQCHSSPTHPNWRERRQGSAQHLPLRCRSRTFRNGTGGLRRAICARRESLLAIGALSPKKTSLRRYSAPGFSGNDLDRV